MADFVSVALSALIIIIIIWVALKALKFIWKLVFFVILLAVFFYSYPYVKGIVEQWLANIF